MKKGAQEGAEAKPAKAAKAPRLKPVSLYPLTIEQALGAALKTPAPPEPKPRVRVRKRA